MARKKAAKNCTILSWLSAKLDNREGRFLQVGNSLFLSDRFNTVDYAAKWLYLCMAVEAGGKREFTFPESAAKKYKIPHATFNRAKQRLKDAGFIEYIPSSVANDHPGKIITYRFTIDGIKNKDDDK